MELIILNDGLYQLIPVSKTMMEHIHLSVPVNLHGTVRDTSEKLSGYANTLNLHIMNDGSGNFVGCVCR